MQWHQKACDSVSTNSSGFSAPENGKRPVFASNQDLHTSSQAERSFQFTRVPSCKSSSGTVQGGGFAWKDECWLGEKPGPLMQPLRDWIWERLLQQERGRERASPNATWLRGECLEHGWTEKQQPYLTVSSDCTLICDVIDSLGHLSLWRVVKLNRFSLRNRVLTRKNKHAFGRLVQN